MRRSLQQQKMASNSGRPGNQRAHRSLTMFLVDFSLVCPWVVCSASRDEQLFRASEVADANASHNASSHHGAGGVSLLQYYEEDLISEGDREREASAAWRTEGMQREDGVLDDQRGDPRPEGNHDPFVEDREVAAEEAVQALLDKNDRLRAENEMLRDKVVQVKHAVGLHNTAGGDWSHGLLEIGAKERFYSDRGRSHEAVNGRRSIYDPFRRGRRGAAQHRAIHRLARQGWERHNQADPDAEPYTTSLQSAQNLHTAAERISHRIEEVPKVARQSMEDSDQYHDILSRVDNAMRSLDKGMKTYRKGAADGIRIRSSDVERALTGPPLREQPLDEADSSGDMAA